MQSEGAITNLMFIMGHPVAHSKSPAMYNAVFAEMGLPWHYDFLDVPTADEAEAVVDLRHFMYMNVTTPYKPVALKLADYACVASRLAGGSNLLINDGAQTCAYNVDGIGCVSFLEREGAVFDGAKTVVCGTGPTAMAIMHAAVQAGSSVHLLGRNSEKAESAVREYLQMECDAFSRSGDACSSAFVIGGSYENSEQAIQNADIVIDATSLGMSEGDPPPFNTGLLNSEQFVMDTVYGHGETALVSAARACGCKAFDGAGMLVSQAVATMNKVCEAFEIDLTVTDEQLFEIMKNAAGFDL